MVVAMEKDGRFQEADKKIAAVCGLYCKSCAWYIATTEDPDKLKRLAAKRNWSVEEGSCLGCRSDKKLPYCDNCKMFACASERGIDFCVDCEKYPCDALKAFQAEMPHRSELWMNLERIKSVGYRQWLSEMEEHYSCSRCGTLNSTYNLKCRKCGIEPSCAHVAKHRQMIEGYFKEK